MDGWWIRPYANDINKYQWKPAGKTVDPTTYKKTARFLMLLPSPLVDLQNTNYTRRAFESAVSCKFKAVSHAVKKQRMNWTLCLAEERLGQQASLICRLHN
jgi:hypothetical protein